jgi:hypothetical protein
MQALGKIIVVIGIIMVIAGIILWLFGDKLNWIGNLPGDIKVKRENFSFYFPVTTMILLSIAISFIIWLIRKFLN